MESIDKGRLNNAQRNALAELVASRFDRRIEAAREVEVQLEKSIAAELAKKFGLATIDGEIERLEKQVKNLHARKTELGFDTDYKGDYRITGGKVQPLLEAKVASRSLAVRQLHDQKLQTQQAIWLAQTVAEAERLAEAADGKEAA